MKCPVCGNDCVSSAEKILAILPTIFRPCSCCSTRILNKRVPLPDLSYHPPCICGKRFIDEVIAHIYVIMVEQGDLKKTDPLYTIGSPLIHPGFAIERPPFLPEKSLVLLSKKVSKETALRIIEEVPEVRGVVRSGDFTPGLAHLNFNAVPRVYELLAGCDVRADVFPFRNGALVLYKQQSLIHIEFPRGYDPKIRTVEQRIGMQPVRKFVDACCGVGTLGLTAACLGVNHVVLNDAWYASAFWSAFNLEVNRQALRISRIRIFEQYRDLKRHPVAREPLKIAETEGEQVIEVYQGDFRQLHHVLTTPPDLSVIDLFNKEDLAANDLVLKEWKEKIGGEVFIP